MPNAVTDFESWGFYCKILVQCFVNNWTNNAEYVGSNVTTVGTNAFKGCKVLTTITLPSKTTKIGSNAFDGCTKLKTITIKSKKLTSKSVSKNAFKGVSTKATIKVPSGKAKTYKTLFQKKGLSKKVKVK